MGLFPVWRKQVVRKSADDAPIDSGFGVVLPASFCKNLAALLVSEVGPDRLYVLDTPYRGEEAVRFEQVLDGQRIQLGLSAHGRVTGP
jgi:hypothetical protein